MSVKFRQYGGKRYAIKLDIKGIRCIHFRMVHIKFRYYGYNEHGYKENSLKTKNTVVQKNNNFITFSYGFNESILLNLFIYIFIEVFLPKATQNGS
ncbi:hypothetical protein BpHYR1_039891 [Brachionus plicatilis]|uniref:Uncharacterized protein n=1 Tax=Brachionus plicatilis TaxID=10195 RepID=A0A3M7RW34_BRAPC|nr:hypothetical protein BpHYR1_039891 [Brachionus plicatilis]